MMVKKRVQFSDQIQIHPVPKNEIRSFIRHFNSKKSDVANILIMNTLNRFSPHQIIVTNWEDLPFKATSDGQPWYQDQTPVILAKLFEQNSKAFHDFLAEYNNQVLTKIPPRSSSPLSYTSHLYNIQIQIMMVSRID